MPKVRSKFLGKPSLGGWLTIANCSFWACTFLGIRLADAYLKNCSPDAVSQLVFSVVMIAFSLPLALPFLLPHFDYTPTLYDVVLGSAVIGLNSIIWGYSLAWMMRRVGRLFSGRGQRPPPLIRRTSAG